MSKKSKISSDCVFLQQLAVIIEELSRKALLCTEPEYFRILFLNSSKVLPGSPDVYYRCVSSGHSTNFR